MKELTLDGAGGRSKDDVYNAFFHAVGAGCTDYFPDAARIEFAPGSYRARIYHGSPSLLSEDALDGDDHYKVVLWTAAPRPLQVLKQRGDQAGELVSSR